jgi:hypothetical protein
MIIQALLLGFFGIVTALLGVLFGKAGVFILTVLRRGISGEEKQRDT